MTVKVSVVVPVYNPGTRIDSLIDSLLTQSLPADEYEVIFGDDASTDGTAQRLDSLAAHHPATIRVIHNSPNSGWPGRPRNLGVQAARGEYVYFVDSDDWLGPEALERMYRYAVQNDSDIVWGQVVGEGRSVPRVIFRKDIPKATLKSHALLSLLTVHKMFRTAMLRKHSIVFAEGPKRLEDHLFVMQAYFAADTISVLGSYPCYHWRRHDDDTHISEERLVPQDYFGSVREVLDIVEANTEPGDFRDKLLSHWFGGKSLYWFESHRVDSYSDDYRRDLFDTVRLLALDRFPPRIDRYLAPRRRVLAQLLRADDLDGMAGYAEWVSGVRAAVLTDELHDDGNLLRLRLTGTLEDADGEPVRVVRDGDRETLRLPERLGLEGVTPDALDVTGRMSRARMDVYLRNRATNVHHLLKTKPVQRPDFDPDGSAVLRVTVETAIDLAGEPSLERRGDVADVTARLICMGWALDSRPSLPDVAAVTATVAGFAHLVGGDVVTVYATEGFGNLSLRRRARPMTGTDRTRRRVRRIVARIRAAIDRRRD